MARFHAEENVIYLGDNGAAYCGAHLGSTAKATGRDLSGQRLLAITPDIATDPDAEGIRCEQCGKSPSRLYV